MPPYEPLKIRFLKHVLFDEPAKCWGWKGGVSPEGYARIKAERTSRFPAYAHRVSWEYFVGRIPNGLVIDHLCRTRSCVNPRHLRVVSHKENILSGVGACASNAKKTVCPHGHPLDGVVRTRYGMGRCCLQCHREGEARRKRRLRAEEAPA